MTDPKKYKESKSNQTFYSIYLEKIKHFVKLAIMVF